LAKDANERNSFLTEEKYQSSNQVGIPVPGENEVGINELKLWVAAARKANGKDMGLAIKADKNTPYAVIKKVMDSLREIDENRYNLITSLKSEE
jgi:biopolymer transport protein ExbD